MASNICAWRNIIKRIGLYFLIVDKQKTKKYRRSCSADILCAVFERLDVCFDECFECFWFVA